ncbi:hypothetical protein JCM13304A_23820 [Desulfothermus okinawensis JCM 13304]
MKKILYLLFTISFTYSCLSMPKKNLVYHTLDIRLDQHGINANTTILISDIKVLPPYDTKKICYSYRDNEVENYVYHLWASPISDMLLYSLVFSGNPTSRIRFITQKHNENESTHELRIVVKNFLHRIQGDKSYVIVDMIFYISKKGIIKQMHYHEKIFCKQNTPYAAVVAFNKALDKIFNDVITKIVW